MEAGGTSGKQELRSWTRLLRMKRQGKKLRILKKKTEWSRIIYYWRWSLEDLNWKKRAKKREIMKIKRSIWIEELIKYYHRKCEG